MVMTLTKVCLSQAAGMGCAKVLRLEGADGTSNLNKVRAISWCRLVCEGQAAMNPQHWPQACPSSSLLSCNPEVVRLSIPMASLSSGRQYFYKYLFL